MQSSSQIITTNKATTSYFYRPDALPVTQPTVLKKWREKYHIPQAIPYLLSAKGWKVCLFQKLISYHICYKSWQKLSDWTWIYMSIYDTLQLYPLTTGIKLQLTESNQGAETFPIRNNTMTCKFVKDHRDIVYLLQATDGRHTQLTRQWPAASQHLQQPPTMHTSSYFLWSNQAAEKNTVGWATKSSTPEIQQRSHLPDWA